MSDTESMQHALDAEQAVVAALFGPSSREIYDRLALLIKPEDFFIRAHGVVFEAYAALVAEGQSPDPATLSSRIKLGFKVDDSVRKVLAEAAAYPYVPETIENSGKLIADKAAGRRIAVSLRNLAERTSKIGGEITSEELLREVDAVVQSGIREAVENHLLETMSDTLAETLNWMERKSAGEIELLSMGIERLDARVAGVEPTDMVVMAGRPSMGKTAAALTVAKNIALQESRPTVPFFSLEMSKSQLMLRLLANVGSIEYGRLRKAALTEEDYDNLGAAVCQVSQMNLRIDCDGELTPAIMRSKLRTLQRQSPTPIGAIFVDYLQLMQPDRLLGNRVTEVSEISRSLKLIAKEFNAPVFALSQLSRKVEERSDKRPMMSDLRESGAIEQDADIIMMLYRDEYYNPDTQHKGVTEINIVKLRNGEPGSVPCAFIGKYQRFADLAFEYDGGPQ